MGGTAQGRSGKAYSIFDDQHIIRCDVYLRGHLGVIRYSPDRTEALCIFHCFKAMEVIRIRLELKAAYSVKMIYEEGNHDIKYRNGELTLSMEHDYEAVAVRLKTEKPV